MREARGHRVVAFLVGLVVVVGGLAAFEGGASAAAYSGPWSVTMSREAGGANLQFDDTNAVLTNSSTSSLVKLSVSGGANGSSFDLEFQAPNEATMAAGWYPDAQRYPFQDAGRPGMSVTVGSSGCNEVTGSFEVREVAWSSGKLTKLWLLYEHHCEGGEKADFGEIRFGMPTASVDVEPHAVHWPDTYPAAQSTVVPVLVRQRGTSVGSISAVALEGAHPQDFAIRSDECTGQSLDEGQSCLVNVRFAPRSPGPRTAVLRITTNTGALRVPLDGYGIPGTTDWSMQSDSGDYIGGGRTYHYTTATDLVTFAGSRTRVSGGVDAANGESWGGTFVPAQGDILVQGNTYPNAHRYLFSGTGAGMDVDGEGRGCNKLVGDFTVDQVGFTSTGALDRLDLTFEQHCEEQTPALHGRLRYRARADYTAPARVTNATATRTSNTTAHLTWANPADADRAGTVVRYLPDTTAPPTNPTVGNLAYTGNGTSVDLSGLTAGRTYSVGIFTYDATGNVSAARVVTVTGSYVPTLSFTTSATTLTYGAAVTHERPTDRPARRRTTVGAGARAVPLDRLDDLEDVGEWHDVVDRPDHHVDQADRHPRLPAPVGGVRALLERREPGRAGQRRAEGHRHSGRQEFHPAGTDPDGDGLGRPQPRRAVRPPAGVLLRSLAHREVGDTLLVKHLQPQLQTHVQGREDVPGLLLS